MRLLLLYVLLGKPIVLLTPMNWTAANDECRSLGMDLVTVETKHKAQLMHQAVKDSNSKYSYIFVTPI